MKQNLQELNERYLAALKEIAVPYDEQNNTVYDKNLCKYLINTAQKAIEQESSPENENYANPGHLSQTIETMQGLNASPDFDKSLQKVKIMLDLERYADCNTVLGMSIVNAIHNKTAPDEVINFIKKESKSNQNAMASVITPELTETILNF